jgi:hypothetical protein
MTKADEFAKGSVMKNFFAVLVGLTDLCHNVSFGKVLGEARGVKQWHDHRMA